MRRPSLVAAALVLGALGPLWNVATNSVEIPDWWTPWVWAVTISLAIVAVLAEVRNQTDGHVGGPSGEIGLDEASDRLAMAVGEQWCREEERRRVHDPFALPVRWRNAPTGLLDHPANYRCLPAGIAAEPLDLTGHLDQIAEIYQRIPSRRLVVLGQAGSGKTVLAVRLLLDLLGTRTVAEPVPMIFSLGSWNPASVSLREWLAEQMVRDHPGLAATGPAGSSLAAALIRTGRILPILDGADEIAEGLHRAALEALNAVKLPLVLTSRSAEYAAAVAGTDVLTNAAGIELTELSLTDLVDYLPRTTRKETCVATTTATVWGPVLSELRDHPHRLASVNLAAVLTTPLMVALARAIYSDTPDRDPSELLDTGRFLTAGAVEDHLLRTFIPTVYRHDPEDHRRWDPARVWRWLGYLAGHLGRLGTRDLAWWQLGNTMPPASRMLVVGGMAGLTYTLADGFAHGFVEGRGLDGIMLGLVNGLVVGLILGVAHGLIGKFKKNALEPVRVRIQIFGTRKRLAHRLAPTFLFGAVGGLMAGVATDFVYHRFVGHPVELNGGPWLSLGLSLAMWFYFGLLVGLAFAVLTALEAPIEIRSVASPSELLNTSRMTVVFQLLVFWFLMVLGHTLLLWLVAGLGVGLEFRLDWLVGGWLMVGLGGGLGSMFSVTAWGRWVVLVRLWLPLIGRLPWPMLAFLDDACRRGVLRQTGAVYQFRHARLQDQLCPRQEVLTRRR